jgi:gas vesicle protein
MKETRRRGGFLKSAVAFTLGAAAGSIVALLYAPASGQVTRKRLAGRVRGLRREAVRRIGRTQRALVTQAEQVREAATEWIAEHVPHSNGRHSIRRRALRHATAR